MVWDEAHRLTRATMGQGVVVDYTYGRDGGGKKTYLFGTLYPSADVEIRIAKFGTPYTSRYPFACITAS